MAGASEDFQSWLSRTLTDLNTDESIFGSYITGILESDETCDEKAEALQDLLEEIVQNADDLYRIKDEILQKWNYYKIKEPPPKELSEDVGIKLSKMIESHFLSRTKQKEYTAEEKKIKEAILSQYSQMSDDEEEGSKETGQGSGEQKDNLEKNTNAQTVANAEKQKREQARLDSMKKKERDKEDREKQKQLKEEKKEKRKTQKGERRR
ncbi:hypothetical protein WA026_020343 [Henosepilachna vigintioctopunctata]|uniref:Coiled-coil domain-containing protein 43 n=1 Tax=Henosepilachna vigintioctopunctata TaxID=420089 RepID=A0AAW1TWA9_9CUCU